MDNVQNCDCCIPSSQTYRFYKNIISYIVTSLKMKNEKISQRYAAILFCKLGKFVSDVTIVH
jgi:hypothetical protein